MKRRIAKLTKLTSFYQSFPDLLSYQVERDSVHAIDGEDGPKDVKHLAEMVERLTRQKAYYEQQANRLPVFVATGSGIVQVRS